MQEEEYGLVVKTCTQKGGNNVQEEEYYGLAKETILREEESGG